MLLTKQNDALCRVLELEAQGKDHTIIVVPSLSLDPRDMANIHGLVHYESRNLWEVLKAGAPGTSIIFISSVPIEKAAFRHLMDLMPNSHAAEQSIRMLSVNDPRTSLSLSEKLIERPRLLKVIRKMFHPENTYLKSCVSSDAEDMLARLLGIPLYGPHHTLKYFQTKSGSRGIFAESSIPFAPGIRDIKCVAELISAIDSLWTRNKDATRFIIKLDTGVAGYGNALLDVPIAYETFSLKSSHARAEIILESLENMTFQSPNMTWKAFSHRLEHGCVLEIFIQGDIKTSPSGQAHIHPDGRIEMLSTHEQILDNDEGMTFIGSMFPADDKYNEILQEHTSGVGRTLYGHGVIGFFSIDFVAVHKHAGTEIRAIEINARYGGTTHPYRTAQFLTNAAYHANTGILVADTGEGIFYMSNDNVVDTRLIGTDIKQFLSFMEDKNIIFNPLTKKGVVFHLLGALADFGKVGYTAIGHSRDESEHFYKETLTRIDQFAKGVLK